MPKLWILGLIIGVILLAATLPTGLSVQAQGLPHVFVGTATIDGARPPDGTTATAVVGGLTVARATVNDGKFTLLVAPPRGQSFTGKTIIFTVGGFWAEERASYQRGEIALQNLDASSARKAIIGDINGDEKVNIVDAALLGSLWGLRERSPGFDQYADLDVTGEIGLDDLTVLTRTYRWGE